MKEIKTYIYLLTSWTRCYSVELALVIIFSISLMGFEEIVDDVFFDPLEGDYESSRFDNKISKAIESFRSKKISAVMRDLTSFGSISIIMILTTIFSYYLYLKKRFKDFSCFLIIIVGSGLITLILKSYYSRARPPSEKWLMDTFSLSFPSGHSLVAASTYFTIAFIFSKKSNSFKTNVALYSLSFFIITIVGVTRIYLGVHFPTDVIGGITLGIAWSSIALVAKELFSTKKRIKIS